VKEKERGEGGRSKRNIHAGKKRGNSTSKGEGIKSMLKNREKKEGEKLRAVAGGGEKRGIGIKNAAALGEGKGLGLNP